MGSARNPSRANVGPMAELHGWSAPRGEADEIRAKADIADGMSEAGGKAVVPAAWQELRLLAETVEKLGVCGGQDARYDQGRGFLFRLGPMAGRVWLV